MANAAETALAIFGDQIGVDEPAGSWVTVDQRRIDAFAETTIDGQFIHVDPERAAAESPYGTTIAHGFLTLSLISHLTYEIPASTPDPYEGAVTVINYGLDRVRWPTPVKVDSRLRAHRRLMSAEPKGDDAIQIKHLVTVEIDGIEKPACVAEWITLAIYA